MRGFVMILMAVDHASQTWNQGRFSADSAYLLDPQSGHPVWMAGDGLEPLQFMTRWITHLCAPTFLFLSGTSLAMSLEKRRSEGSSERSLDRHLLIRAGVILAFEGGLSLLAARGVLILQVLFAIGASMLAMIALRRLPTRALVGLALLWLAGSELVLMHFFPIGADERPLWARLLFVPSYSSPVTVLYPMTHWLAMMALGWAFGRHWLEQPETEHGRQQVEKLLLLSGLTALLAWAYLRSRNAYGNMGLLRDDTSVLQWLHMSKYPPSLTFSCMELGLMALCLVAFLRFERRMEGAPNRWNPLLVFGQTALFFYVLHFVLLGGSALVLTGGLMQRDLTAAWIAAAVVLVALYPVCLGFRALKRRHPRSLLQYL
ncbi:MAG: DUF1624 domain-containing protein [bacterium]